MAQGTPDRREITHAGSREIRGQISSSAFKEYERLDHAVAEIVDKKLTALETRAAEIGKPLTGNLSGYREIKLRDAGFRIIYEVSRDNSSSPGVVYVLAVQRRDKDQAFESAAKRMKSGGQRIGKP